MFGMNGILRDGRFYGTIGAVMALVTVTVYNRNATAIPPQTPDYTYYYVCRYHYHVIHMESTSTVVGWKCSEVERDTYI